MDSITSELAPTLDVVEHELRFFSALTLDQVHDALRPAELVNTVMDYRYRIDRILDFVDTTITQQRTVVGVLGTARMWIERLAFVAVLGVVGVWLAERFTGHARGVFNTNAGFLLFLVAAIFVAAVLRQTRKLPDTGTRGGRRRRLKRRTTARSRNGWPSPPTTPPQPNRSATRGSARPEAERTQ